MFAIKNKLLLINITVIVAINIHAAKVPLLELSVGDIVNITYFDESSTELMGNLFDHYITPEYTKTYDFVDTHHIIVSKNTCLSYESLASYTSPEIIIENTKSDLSKIPCMADKMKYNYFGIDQDYISQKYFYGIFKLCRIVKTRNLTIQMIDESDFPITNRFINYKLLLDKTAVLRLKHSNESHVVSSITTGDCLLQVYVNNAELCNFPNECKKKWNFDNYFFETSLSKTRVIISSNMRDRENQVNDYLDKSGALLFNSSHLPKTHFDILNFLDTCAVIRLELHSLPKLPETLKQPLEKSFIERSLLRSLKPGDIINVNDLKNFNSFITIDTMLVDVPDGTINSSFAIEYTDCYEYNENDAVKLDFVTYKSYSHYSLESYYKFDVFDETVKRRHYGVDRTYLNRNYKCVKITICSELQRQKLIIPTVRVINLDRQTDNNSNIFNNENLVLRYVMNNETHYVARTEKGNCLFQALIYPNDDDKSNDNAMNSPLLYIGKILSATNDRILENRAENYINNLTIDSYRTLMNAMDNPSTRASFFSEYFPNNYDKTLINIYLDKLH